MTSTSKLHENQIQNLPNFVPYLDADAAPAPAQQYSPGAGSNVHEVESPPCRTPNALGLNKGGSDLRQDLDEPQYCSDAHIAAYKETRILAHNGTEERTEKAEITTSSYTLESTTPATTTIASSSTTPSTTAQTIQSTLSLSSLSQPLLQNSRDPQLLPPQTTEDHITIPSDDGMRPLSCILEPLYELEAELDDEAMDIEQVYAGLYVPVKTSLDDRKYRYGEEDIYGHIYGDEEEEFEEEEGEDHGDNRIHRWLEQQFTIDGSAEARTEDDEKRADSPVLGVETEVTLEKALPTILTSTTSQIMVEEEDPHSHSTSPPSTVTSSPETLYTVPSSVTSASASNSATSLVSTDTAPLRTPDMEGGLTFGFAHAKEFGQFPLQPYQPERERGREKQSETLSNLTSATSGNIHNVAQAPTSATVHGSAMSAHSHSRSVSRTSLKPNSNSHSRSHSTTPLGQTLSYSQSHTRPQSSTQMHHSSSYSASPLSTPSPSKRPNAVLSRSSSASILPSSQQHPYYSPTQSTQFLALQSQLPSRDSSILRPGMSSRPLSRTPSITFTPASLPALQNPYDIPASPSISPMTSPKIPAATVPLTTPSFHTVSRTTSQLTRLAAKRKSEQIVNPVLPMGIRANGYGQGHEASGSISSITSSSAMSHSTHSSSHSTTSSTEKTKEKDGKKSGSKSSSKASSRRGSQILQLIPKSLSRRPSAQMLTLAKNASNEVEVGPEQVLSPASTVTPMSPLSGGLITPTSPSILSPSLSTNLLGPPLSASSPLPPSSLPTRRTSRIPSVSAGSVVSMGHDASSFISNTGNLGPASSGSMRGRRSRSASMTLSSFGLSMSNLNAKESMSSLSSLGHELNAVDYTEDRRNGGNMENGNTEDGDGDVLSIRNAVYIDSEEVREKLDKLLAMGQEEIEIEEDRILREEEEKMALAAEELSAENPHITGEEDRLLPGRVQEAQTGEVHVSVGTTTGPTPGSSSATMSTTSPSVYVYQTPYASSSQVYIGPGSTRNDSVGLVGESAYSPPASPASDQVTGFLQSDSGSEYHSHSNSRSSSSSRNLRASGSGSSLGSTSSSNYECHNQNMGSAINMNMTSSVLGSHYSRNHLVSLGMQVGKGLSGPGSRTDWELASPVSHDAGTATSFSTFTSSSTSNNFSASYSTPTSTHPHKHRQDDLCGHEQGYDLGMTMTMTESSNALNGDATNLVDVDPSLQIYSGQPCATSASESFHSHSHSNSNSTTSHSHSHSLSRSVSMSLSKYHSRSQSQDSLILGMESHLPLSPNSVTSFSSSKREPPTRPPPAPPLDMDVANDLARAAEQLEAKIGMGIKASVDIISPVIERKEIPMELLSPLSNEYHLLPSVEENEGDVTAVGMNVMNNRVLGLGLDVEEEMVFARTEHHDEGEDDLRGLGLGLRMRSMSGLRMNKAPTASAPGQRKSEEMSEDDGDSSDDDRASFLRGLGLEDRIVMPFDDDGKDASESGKYGGGYHGLVVGDAGSVVDVDLGLNPGVETSVGIEGHERGLSKSMSRWSLGSSVQEERERGKERKDKKKRNSRKSLVPFEDSTLKEKEKEGKEKKRGRLASFISRLSGVPPPGGSTPTTEAYDIPPVPSVPSTPLVASAMHTPIHTPGPGSSSLDLLQQTPHTVIKGVWEPESLPPTPPSAAPPVPLNLKMMTSLTSISTTMTGSITTSKSVPSSPINQVRPSLSRGFHIPNYPPPTPPIGSPGKLMRGQPLASIKSTSEGLIGATSSNVAFMQQQLPSAMQRPVIRGRSSSAADLLLKGGMMKATNATQNSNYTPSTPSPILLRPALVKSKSASVLKSSQAQSVYVRGGLAQQQHQLAYLDTDDDDEEDDDEDDDDEDDYGVVMESQQLSGGDGMLPMSMTLDEKEKLEKEKILEERWARTKMEADALEMDKYRQYVSQQGQGQQRRQLVPRQQHTIPALVPLRSSADEPPVPPPKDITPSSPTAGLAPLPASSPVVLVAKTESALKSSEPRLPFVQDQVASVQTAAPTQNHAAPQQTQLPQQQQQPLRPRLKSMTSLANLNSSLAPSSTSAIPTPLSSNNSSPLPPLPPALPGTHISPNTPLNANPIPGGANGSSVSKPSKGFRGFVQRMGGLVSNNNNANSAGSSVPSTPITSTSPLSVFIPSAQSSSSGIITYSSHDGSDTPTTARSPSHSPATSLSINGVPGDVLPALSQTQSRNALLSKLSLPLNGGGNSSAPSSNLPNMPNNSFSLNSPQSPAAVAAGPSSPLSLPGMKGPKRKLLISGVEENDAEAYEAVRSWCEIFGEIKEMRRAKDGSGRVCVDFKKKTVAETVCRLQSQVYIKGVGSVSVSWYTNKKEPSL